MAKLYFENSYGEERVIADCNTPEEVSKAIDAFILTCNKNKPKDKWFKIYYTRFWVENGSTHYDVGSHTEFFRWEKEYQINDSVSRSKNSGSSTK